MSISSSLPLNKDALREKLMEGIRTNQPGLVQACLDAGAPVTQRFGGDITPLMVTAIFDRPAMAEMVLARGAPIDDTAEDGMTALHQACRTGGASVAQLLLNRGADPMRLGGDATRLPIHLAASDGSLECVRILLDAGSHFDGADALDGREETPLDIAVACGSYDVVRALILAGADMDRARPGKRSLLREAEFQDHFDVLYLLLAHGAAVPDDVTGRYRHVDMLEAAVRAADVERLSQLLEQGGADALDRVPALRIVALEGLSERAEDLVAAMDAWVARAAIARLAAPPQEQSTGHSRGHGFGAR